MKNKLYLFLIIQFCHYFYASAQNCESLKEWNTIIQQEWPNLNTGKVRSGSEQSNRILYNLYSDKFFIPFANKSFEKSNTIWGTSKWKKIRDCKNKKDYSQLAHIGWLSQIALAPLWNKRVTEEVKQEIIKLNTTRKEFEKEMAQLESGTVSLGDISRLKGYITTKYQRLLPSEIAAFKNLINTKENSVSNSVLLVSANRLYEKKITVPLLSELLYFHKDNSKVYDASDHSTRKKANDIINAKILESLNQLVSKEQKKLVEIGTNVNAFDQLEQFYSGFHSTFSKFKDYPIVKDTYHEIIRKKSSIVTEMYNTVDEKIKIATNLNQLSQIKSIYLSNVDKTQPAILKLNTSIISATETIKTREREIEFAKKRELIAQEEEAKRKRLEEIENAKRLKLENLRRWKKMENGIVTYANEYWHEYHSKNRGGDLRTIFDGKFKDIPKESVSFLVYEFVVWYSDYCGSYIQNASPVGLKQRYYEPISNNADMSGYTYSYKEVMVDDLIVGRFLRKFNGTLLVYRDLNNYSSYTNFYKNFGCDSDEIKQLYENMMRLELNKPSLQSK